jgi:hypothetical protein
MEQEAEWWNMAPDDAPKEGDRVYDDDDDHNADADYVENDNNVVDETGHSDQQTNSDNDDKDVLD